MRLSSGASAAWLEFCQRLEPSLEPQLGQMAFISDWCGKLTGLAARLAGLIHVMEHLAQAPDLAISPKTMERALTLAAVLLEHAKAAFGMMGADPDIEAARPCLNWLRREQPERFSVRDCHRAVAGRLPKVDQVRKALGILDERGYVRPEQAGQANGPGRPASLFYRVNPKALGDKHWLRPSASHGPARRRKATPCPMLTILTKMTKTSPRPILSILSILSITRRTHARQAAWPLQYRR